MFQIAVIDGKVKDLDLFVLSIVFEVKNLGESDLIVKKHNGEIINLMLTTYFILIFTRRIHK